MDLKGFDTRQWWIAMVVVGSALLGAAIAAHERDLILIAFGIVTFAFGEWRNHPLQTSISPGWHITSYPRRFTAFGTALDVIGIALIALGLYRLIRG